MKCIRTGWVFLCSPHCCPDMFELVSGIIIHSKQSSGINHAEQENRQDTFLDLTLIRHIKKTRKLKMYIYYSCVMCPILEVIGCWMSVAINSILALPSFPAFRVFLKKNTSPHPLTLCGSWRAQIASLKSCTLILPSSTLRSFRLVLASSDQLALVKMWQKQETATSCPFQKKKSMVALHKISLFLLLRHAVLCKKTKQKNTVII